MTSQDRQDLDRMFHPRGVAVFGAVHQAGKFGHMIIQSLKRYGYSGQIYPIYPGDGDCKPLKVYHSLGEVTGPVDLAIVSVPAKMVPDVLRDCLRQAVTGAEIISSGFAETGKARGIDLQKEVVRIARKGIRILGPNCFGACCPSGEITILPGFDFSKECGPVALISQSGGVAADFGHEARMAGFGVSKIVSFGNGCDLDAIALLDYLSEDTETRYVGAYLEGVSDGQRFMQVLKKVTSKKPVVVWKGGLTPTGSNAVRSHTGSLGGDAPIWKGVLAQAGVVSVGGLEEMVDTMMALVHLRRRGRRVALLGGGGAIGVFSSDLAHQWGLDLPTFSPGTQRRLRGWFSTPGNSVANPLDTGSPVIPLEAISGMMEDILTREPVDALVVIMLIHPLGVVAPAFMGMDDQRSSVLQEYMDSLLEVSVRIRESTGKDIIVVIENRANLPVDNGLEGTSRAIRLGYLSQGVPVYASVKRALRAIRNAAGIRAL